MIPILPSVPAAQQLPAFSFTELLMERNDNLDFASTSNEATGMTSTLLKPHLDAALLAPPQLPFGPGPGARAPTPLAGSESPAFMRLQQLCQRREAQICQVTHDYEHLR